MSRSQFHQRSREVALCGMFTALSVVILTLGGVLPLATFLCPLIAMLCLIPVLCEHGTGPALLLYTGASILGLLLCPDKECALFYLFLGWYPAVQSRVDALPRFLRPIAKCGVFSLSMAAMYTMILYLFRLEAVTEEFAGYTAVMLVLLLIEGNVTFLLFDRVLKRLFELYRKKRGIQR